MLTFSPKIHNRKKEKTRERDRWTDRQKDGKTKGQKEE